MLWLTRWNNIKERCKFSRIQTKGRKYIMINPDKVDVQIKEMSKEQLIDISKEHTQTRCISIL